MSIFRTDSYMLGSKYYRLEFSAISCTFTIVDFESCRFELSAPELLNSFVCARDYKLFVAPQFGTSDRSRLRQPLWGLRAILCLAAGEEGPNSLDIMYYG